MDIKYSYTLVFQPYWMKLQANDSTLRKFCSKCVALYVKITRDNSLVFLGGSVGSVDYLSVSAVDHLYPPVQLQKRRLLNFRFPVHNRQRGRDVRVLAMQGICSIVSRPLVQDRSDLDKALNYN